MKWIASLLLAVNTLFITGCDCSRKTWECPGFDSPELSGWFPYANASILIFQNNTGQRDTIHLNNTETSAPYTTSGTARYCSSHRDLESMERMPNSMLKMAVRLSKSENNGNFINSAVISLHTNKAIEFLGISAAALGAARFNYSEMSLQYQASLIIGGRTFNDAAIAARDTATDKTAGLYKLYIAKNLGVVGYEELPSRSLFVLQ